MFEDGVDHVVDCLHVEGHALLRLEVGEVGRRRRRVAVFIERARSEDSSCSRRIHRACAPPSSASRSQSGIHVLVNQSADSSSSVERESDGASISCAASEMSKVTLPQYTSRCFGKDSYRHDLLSYMGCKSKQKRLGTREKRVRVDLISSRCRKTWLEHARSTVGRLEDDHPNCQEAPERSWSQLACALARRSVHLLDVARSSLQPDNTHPVNEDAAPIVCYQQTTDKTA